MTDNEIAGRMLVLETMSMTTLGTYLANSTNDQDFSRSILFLDYLRDLIAEKASELNVEASDVAQHYADDLLSQALENLRLLRGSDIQPLPPALDSKTASSLGVSR